MTLPVVVKRPTSKRTKGKMKLVGVGLSDGTYFNLSGKKEAEPMWCCVRCADLLDSENRGEMNRNVCRPCEEKIYG